MTTDPNPDEIIAVVNSQHSIMESDSGRPIITNLFEMKRSMRRILFQQFEILTSKLLSIFVQIFEALPESWCGTMRL